MITRFITEVSTAFNPFRKPAGTCRKFLAHLPANARQNMKINTKVLPKDSREPCLLKLKFSRFSTLLSPRYKWSRGVNLESVADAVSAEDGKEMDLDPEKLSIKDVMEEVDRHSRLLKRQADLTGS